VHVVKSINYHLIFLHLLGVILLLNSVSQSKRLLLVDEHGINRCGDLPSMTRFGRSLVGDANKLGSMSSLRDTPRLFTLLASGEMFEGTGNITLRT
jgi:hypothetical protein